MTMESAMIKAIRLFKKEHKKAEIRTCSAWEMSGTSNAVDYALFGIEYVEEPGGEYKQTKISIVERENE